MVFRPYDSRAKQQVEFAPMAAGKVSLYHCGPTVYSTAHIGNFRSFLFADTLRRTLEYLGYEVFQIMNITDVGHLESDADEGDVRPGLDDRLEPLGEVVVLADHLHGGQGVEDRAHAGAEDGVAVEDEDAVRSGVARDRDGLPPLVVHVVLGPSPTFFLMSGDPMPTFPECSTSSS